MKAFLHAGNAFFVLSGSGRNPLRFYGEVRDKGVMDCAIDLMISIRPKIESM